MIPGLTVRRPLAVLIREFFWLHPEWWSIALCCFAWGVMLVSGWQHAVHGIRHRLSFAQEFEYWMWMVVAMMLPFALEAVRLTSARSLWARRHRAMAGFVAGFLSTWLLVGIAAAGLRELSWTHTYAAAAFGFLAAALWQPFQHIGILSLEFHVDKLSRPLL